MSGSSNKTDEGDVAEANSLDQSTITMVDVLEEEKELEEEYAAVLGGSDENACTYAKGKIQRQALYSCLTCCPEAREDVSKCAGVCLACSYRCHENHELIELYTKRNFRCDCPTLRFGEELRCALNSQLETVQPANTSNVYNHNFQGLYCKCKRPYPDPERTSEEVMLQCAICEDWFHLQHIDAPAMSEKLLNASCEMICDDCMEHHDFLRDYTGLALQLTESQDSKSENEVKDIQVDAEKQPPEQPLEKRQKLEDTGCRRPKAPAEHKGATFWSNDWRKSLCRCSNCVALYKEQSVKFLLDADDSVKAYEDRGKNKAEGNSSYAQAIRALASIDRIQQINVISEYNIMGEKLKEFLQSFAANNKVVTEDDIKRFFAGMSRKRSATVAQPYYCR